MKRFIPLALLLSTTLVSRASAQNLALSLDDSFGQNCPDIAQVRGANVLFFNSYICVTDGIDTVDPTFGTMDNTSGVMKTTTGEIVLVMASYLDSNVGRDQEALTVSVYDLGADGLYGTGDDIMLVQQHWNLTTNQVRYNIGNPVIFEKYMNYAEYGLTYVWDYHSP